MLEGKPEVSEVVAYRTHLLELWGAAHTHWEKVDSFINRTFEVWPGDKYRDRPKIRPGRANAIVAHAVDNQLAFDPKIHRPPRGTSDRAKKRADRIEPFLTSVFSEASLLEPSLTFKQAGRHLLTYGYTVIAGPLLSMKDRPDEPRKEKHESKDDFEIRMALFENEMRTWMPFRIRAPHPAKVLMDPLEKQPEVAVIHAKRFVHELHTMWHNMKKRTDEVEVSAVFPWDNMKPFEEIETDEVWNKEYHALFPGGQMLFIAPNKPGYNPYTQAFSGFGQEPTTPTQGMNPRDLAVGVLDPIMDILVAQAQAFSSVHNALVEASFRHRMTTGSAQELEEQEARGDNVVEVIGGKDSLWWEDMPQLPSWQFEAIRMLDQDIEFASFSKQLAGIRETGVTTVGQQAILSTAAARKFVAPQKQLEHLATVTAGRILRLVDVLGEPLTVEGHKITPADVEHDYSIQVKFELLDPVMQMQERLTAMNEHSNGLLSKESYWAKTRLEDATGEQRRLDEESVRNLPIVLELRQRQILEEWGILEEAEKLEEQLAAEAAAQGGPGAPSSPQPLTPNTPGQFRQGDSLGATSLNDPI